MKRILVADDSVTIQKVIALTFADEPFEVQSVGTGAEALELFKSWKPDIVLADVIMPQMNGYELCRAVKQQEETSMVPVLLLAGTFEAFDEEEAKSVGANDFITKPFESGELIEKVKSLTGGTPVAQATTGASTEVSATTVDPATMPEVVAQVAPEASSPPPPAEAPEPDIWDILSDSGDDAEVQMTEGDASIPGFGPIEDTGVVDVGSFDVGLGRPESPPSTPPPAAAPPPESVQAPGTAVGSPGLQVQPPPPAAPPAQAAPPSVDQLQDVEDVSRIENMEKGFFGFETGGVEEITATDIPDDAVEEVTFEMEQPQAAPVVDVQEVSFVVPEPTGEQAVITGETISPDFMALTPPPAPEPVPVSPPAPAPVPEPVPEVSIDFATQPVPEPPLELEVDLTPDLPVEFTPEPIEEQILEIPAPPIPEQVMPEPVIEVPAIPPSPQPGSEQPAGTPLQAAGGVPDEAAIKQLVEEKVEKIAWEVVPEMAEVIIREVIRKIKDGT